MSGLVPFSNTFVGSLLLEKQNCLTQKKINYTNQNSPKNYQSLNILCPIKGQ